MWIRRPSRRAPPKPIVAATYVPGMQPTRRDERLQRRRQELESANISRLLFPDGNVGLPITVSTLTALFLILIISQDPCAGLGVWISHGPDVSRFMAFAEVPDSVVQPACHRAMVILKKAKQESQNLSHLVFPKGNVSFFNF